jgi:hypothetical protein
MFHIELRFLPDNEYLSGLACPTDDLPIDGLYMY